MREARGPAWTDWLHEHGIVALCRDRHALARPAPARRRARCARSRSPATPTVEEPLARRRASSRRWPAARSSPASRRASRTSTRPRAGVGSRSSTTAASARSCGRLAAAGAAVTVYPHDADADELAAPRRRPALQRPRRPGAARRRGRRPCASCSAACRCSASASATSCSRSRPATRRSSCRSATAARTTRCSTARPTACSSRARTTASRSSRPTATEATHVSLYDGTVEGLAFPELRARSVQFHPEAGPGPARRLADSSSRGSRRCARAAAYDLQLDLPDRLRPDRDRPGLRVRLRRLPGAEGAARGRLPHDRRQLEPGDDHDRPRLRRPHLPRAARPRRRRRRARAASGPTRCCRRSAARRRSTSRASWPRPGSSTRSGSS